MKRIRQPVLLSLALMLTAYVLAAASGVHPEKKCYNAAGDEIPCDSNYLQTREAARATARDSGPSFTPPPSATTTATPTGTATLTETPAPTLTQTLEAATPTPSGPLATPLPSATMVLIPLLMLGCAGVLVVALLFMLYRWYSGRHTNPPGPPN